MGNKSDLPVYWSLLIHQDWRLHIAATAKGLCFVGSQNHNFEEMSEWSKACFPGSTLIQDDAKLEPFAAELIEYLQGSRKNFTIPFDFYGTPFQLSVWNALCKVPYGETASYSDIAEQIQRPAAVRAVGAAIGANPVLITVPCHRVIGKGGALTGYRGGLDMKTLLLQLEQDGSHVKSGA
ncbi:methylated-DNA--[protein]-cysteine S-methyltransferase [Paenibacillus solisilvae]|uniref:Methylated-DNA--[protein]-cysteine S-methyltransferase n=1 Tax=Paenibacillus solisilvae TaxID=2486751 RepID=A0ABW0W385_9BACL